MYMNTSLSSLHVSLFSGIGQQTGNDASTWGANARSVFAQPIGAATATQNDSSNLLVKTGQDAALYPGGKGNGGSGEGYFDWVNKMTDYRNAATSGLASGTVDGALDSVDGLADALQNASANDNAGNAAEESVATEAAQEDSADSTAADKADAEANTSNNDNDSSNSGGLLGWLFGG